MLVCCSCVARRRRPADGKGGAWGLTLHKWSILFNSVPICAPCIRLPNTKVFLKRSFTRIDPARLHINSDFAVRLREKLRGLHPISSLTIGSKRRGMWPTVLSSSAKATVVLFQKTWQTNKEHPKSSKIYIALSRTSLHRSWCPVVKTLATHGRFPSPAQLDLEIANFPAKMLDLKTWCTDLSELWTVQVSLKYLKFKHALRIIASLTLSHFVSMPMPNHDRHQHTQTHAIPLAKSCKDTLTGIVEPLSKRM